jgi:hypothetical protein
MLVASHFTTLLFMLAAWVASDQVPRQIIVENILKILSFIVMAKGLQQQQQRVEREKGMIFTWKHFKLLENQFIGVVKKINKRRKVIVTIAISSLALSVWNEVEKEIAIAVDFISHCERD